MYMPTKMKHDLVSNHYTKWLQEFDQDSVNQLVIEHLIQLKLKQESGEFIHQRNAFMILVFVLILLSSCVD